MKLIIRYFIIVQFILFTITSKAQVYLAEDFENGGSAPSGWSQEYVSGNANWTYKDGGLLIGGENHPEHAFEGNYNALFGYSTTYKTKLLTPAIDLSDATKPMLRFWHAMQEYAGDIDELRVFFKPKADTSWMLLRTYTTEVHNWTLREIYLPDSLLSPNCYIAFEGTSKWGAGVCIDSVSVFEKGIVPKKINEISIKSVTEDFIPTGSSNNVILRIDFDVTGNNGTLLLEDINITSLN
ncbi:MAG: choice-of-anchor J domain-containing protein, partial [Bacteroidales bacterium]